jgi:hypothetical protein
MRQRGQTIMSLISVRSRGPVLTMEHSVLTETAAIHFIRRDNSFDVAARGQP